ncbi:hypothetical protein IV203_001749 [Nitzschia inconspicua]|uniref:Uncharacterized protein n=1 Tax=Nitzschia inconspicua TaxID=303405 RepID=A0A9K3L9Z0_9STRA|nr:hypothetical protein IV203_001749 [Nitzschia inconspicua]
MPSKYNAKSIRCWNPFCIFFSLLVLVSTLNQHIAILPAQFRPILTDRDPTPLSNSLQDPSPSPHQQRKIQIGGACWRRCPHTRRNHIVMNVRQKAGLNDRQYIIECMAHIAGFLCANLHIPSPRTWFYPYHNRGVPLPTSADWSDYQNWTWTVPDMQGKPVTNTLYELPAVSNTTTFNVNANISVSPLYSLESFLNRRVSPNGQTWYSTMDVSPFPKHHFVANRNVALEQILALNDIVDDQWKLLGNGVNESDIGGFLWEIPINPYDMKLFGDRIRVALKVRNRTILPSFPDNLKRRKRGCQYVSKSPSRFVREVVRRVWDDVHESTATIGFLHIRRGDAVVQCNTTIPNMKLYLSCSLANTAKHGNIKLLVSTDETDPAYLEDVRTILQDLYPHVKMVHLDPLIESHSEIFARELDEGGDSGRFVNSFFTFQVENVIRYQRAAFVLIQRRSECNACDALSRRQKIKWAGQR